MQPYCDSDLGHFQDTTHDDDGYDCTGKNGGKAQDTVPGRNHAQWKSG